MEHSKYEFLKEAFEIENIQEKLDSFPGKTRIKTQEILEVISRHEFSLSRELKSASSATITKIVKHVWPDKPADIKLDSYYFRKFSMKYCPNCRNVKDTSAFSLNAGKLDGLNTHCKVCYTETTREYQRSYQASRDALQDSRIPSWADLTKIREIYAKCPKGMHVDHWAPLKGELVCGLHVEHNLQYLTAEENIKKSNRFEPCSL